jgi:hypothetical protein
MKHHFLAILVCVFAALPSYADDQITLRQTSRSGFKGWTVATAKHSQGTWMNSTLVIVTRDKVQQKIHASRAFIEVWGFTESDKAVVVRSRNAHGPSWIEKFDSTTGKLIAECPGSNHIKDTPTWAQPWCDESTKPAEQGTPPNRP